MSVVKRMWKYPRIFFVHNMDWRGRLYPVPDYLSPQGTDVSRALLRFADTKPLGMEGVFWLAVTGAGLMKEDPETHLNIASLSLDQRAQWTLAHSDDIRAVADDPLGTISWWSGADKPLQFYAFCLEWKGYLDHGQEYECALPCHADAVSSGLQHLAASWRDEVLSENVCLTPTDRPSDQYQIMTDCVLALLTEAAHTEDDPRKREDAGIWLQSDLVTRSLVKRPTMTFTYGATMYGFTDQIVDYLRQKDLTAKIGESRAQVRNRSRYLAEVVWAALKTSVGSAYSAMAWMRRCASEICKHSNDPIRWHSPLGLPIFMEYYKLKEFQVETILAGKVVKPTVYGSLDQTDGYKSTNGLPANFVHSLDAATLQKTICLAYRRGVRSFGVVHDSFARSRQFRHRSSRCRSLGRCDQGSVCWTLHRVQCRSRISPGIAGTTQGAQSPTRPTSIRKFRYSDGTTCPVFL
jgi:DNA-directed RNA polymerase